MTIEYKTIASAEAAHGWCVVSHVYVLLFHDVWAIEAGEDTSVVGVFTTRATAEAAKQPVTGQDYYTIEQHEVTS